MSNSNTSESAEGSTVAGTSGAAVDESSPTVESEPTEMAPNSVEESEDEEESLSLDIVFGILSNRRRQLVLEYLRDNDGEATTGELAEHIAAIENDTTVQQLNAQQRKRVYIGLYQSHLPKMDDVDVIDFNQSRGRVSPGRHVEPLYEYLDVANDDEGESDEGENIPQDHAEDPGGISAITSGSTGDEPTVFNRAYGAGYLLFATAFFAAQLSGAHVIASGIVVTFLAAVLLVSYGRL